MRREGQSYIIQRYSSYARVLQAFSESTKSLEPDQARIASELMTIYLEYILEKERLGQCPNHVMHSMPT